MKVLKKWTPVAPPSDIPTSEIARRPEFCVGPPKNH
jgi:hypothetical protein